MKVRIERLVVDGEDVTDDEEWAKGTHDFSGATVRVVDGRMEIETPDWDRDQMRLGDLSPYKAVRRLSETPDMLPLRVFRP